MKITIPTLALASCFGEVNTQTISETSSGKLSMHERMQARETPKTQKQLTDVNMVQKYISLEH